MPWACVTASGSHHVVDDPGWRPSITISHDYDHRPMPDTAVARRNQRD
jgi:hypothetical protein